MTEKSPRIFPDVDADGDGLVDGTKIPYDDVVDKRGVTDPDNFTNANPIVPPEYIKIVNSTDAGSCKVLVANTSVFESGGFFKNTTFSDGVSELVGPSGESSVFEFVDPSTLMY